jgi:hypothetical protein
VEGKISRKEFNRIQEADTSYQKTTQKKAAASAGSAWIAPGKSAHQTRLTVNVLGKERIMPVNVCNLSAAILCILSYLCCDIAWCNMGLGFKRSNENRIFANRGCHAHRT